MAHDAWLTLAIAGALGLSLFTSAHGWRRAQGRLRRPGRLGKDSSGSTALPPIWRVAGIAFGIILAALSLLRTEVEFGTFSSQNSLLASIDLVDAEIVVRPDDWRDHELSQRRFRIGWCGDNGLPALACEAPEAEPLGPARTAWCEANAITDCPAKFRELDSAFAAEWKDERSAYLDNLVRPDLRGRDLRRASASAAFLARIDLSEARLEGADLSGARLQSAEWAGATVGPSLAHSADFTAGLNLTQTQLEDVIGDADTILPLDAETGEQLYVWSCWEDVPERFEQLSIEHWEDTPESLRDQMLEEGWLCAEGQVPRKVGTPAEAAAPSAD